MLNAAILQYYQDNPEATDLQGADLRYADLWGANLRDADLQGADLWGADLRYANLWGADLQGATLTLGGLTVKVADDG